MLNQRYNEFVTIINEHFVEQTAKKGQQSRDYNKMVAQLNEDAQREAHQNYLAKLKKKAEQERRILKREGKRQARLNAKLLAKRKNAKGGTDKLSASGTDMNTSGLPGGKAINDGTKTEKSDAADDLISNGAPMDGAGQNAKQTGAAKQSLGVDVLHESYVAADQ